jgi:hypothetical protein
MGFSGEPLYRPSTAVQLTVPGYKTSSVFVLPLEICQPKLCMPSKQASYRSDIDCSVFGALTLGNLVPNFRKLAGRCRGTMSLTGSVSNKPKVLYGPGSLRESKTFITKLWSMVRPWYRIRILLRRGFVILPRTGSNANSFHFLRCSA